jgi:hypothetical protein
MSEHPECRVVAQARCAGPVPTAVHGVAAAGPDPSDRHGYITIRFGSLLLHLEDPDALASLVEIVDQAADWGELIFATAHPAVDGDESDRREP